MYGPDAPQSVELALRLFDDIATMYPSLSSSVKRDKAYVQRRVAHEGIQFLLKTMPAVGRIFDMWLKDESGTLDFSTAYVAPAFLQGVCELIKASDTELHDRATLVRFIRQLSYLNYKVEVPYTNAQLESAYNAFVERDEDLESSDAQINWWNLHQAAEILGEVLGSFDRTGISPRHGPGAVATGEVGDDKWRFRRIFRSVHRRFPWYEFFVPSLSSWSSDPQRFALWYKSLEVHQFPTARVVAVPKDSRGPRLISEEPLELQFLQQGYFRCLTSHVERHRLTSGFVNFTKQEVNQQLALAGSRTGEWATLDLSDASDRVSDTLVYLLYPERVYKDLRALRSHQTILPDGRVVKLRKFAPMGSAVCFPVMALTIWSLAKAAMASATGCSDGLCYVYGDDIVVPSDMAEIVCSGLTMAGLLVNQAKSYCTGSFRESCGVDAWHGYNVTPARLRHFAPSTPLCFEALTNWVACGNLLRASGWEESATYVKSVVDSVIHLPWNIHGSSLSHVDSSLSCTDVRVLNAEFSHRCNPKLQRLEVRAPCLRAVVKRAKVKGYERLHRNLVVRPRNPNTWQPRRAVRLKWAWLTYAPQQP